MSSKLSSETIVIIGFSKLLIDKLGFETIHSILRD